MISYFPNLSLSLLSGGSTTINQLSKERLIVVFYRGFHCRICFRYIRRWAAFRRSFAQQGFSLLAVSADSKDKAWQTKDEWFLEDLPLAYGLPVSEAVGLGLNTSQGKGIDQPAEFFEPALFVLDKDLRIMISSIQNSAYARPDVEQLLEDLKEKFGQR